jgi:hypothetical protein
MRPEFKDMMDKFHATHAHQFKPKEPMKDDGDGDKDIGEPKHNETATEPLPDMKTTLVDRYNAERQKRGMTPVTGDGSHHSHFQPRMKDKGHFKGPPSRGWSTGRGDST